MNLNLKKLIALDACKDGLRCYKKNDCPLTVEETVLKLMDSNEPGKFKWSNWLLTHVFTKEQNVQYAVFAAEQVLFIFEKQFPENFRVRNAINSAKEYLKSPLKKNRIAAAAAAYASNVNIKITIINYGLSILNEVN